MATFNKRGPKQWQVKIRRAGYPTETATFETKKKAEEWARSVERDMDKGVYMDTSEAQSTTLKQALNRYLKEITPTKKGAQNEGYRIKAWMEHPLALRPLTRVRSADIAEYRDQRLNEGMAPSTIRNELNAISHLYNIASKKWGIRGILNPVEHVRMPQPRQGRDRRLQADEETRLLETAKTPMKEIIILALETGKHSTQFLF